MKEEKQQANIEDFSTIREMQKQRSPHTDDLVDHYWYSINYISDLIKSSELKAGLILSFYGILINFIYNNVSLIDIKEVESWLLTGFGVLLICTIVTSIFFSVRCFVPKIEGKFNTNVFFFKDVISKFGDINSFSRSFYEVSIDETKVFKQLGEQVYINSKIADWKFKNVNRSIRFLILSLFLLFIFLIYYSIKVNA